MSFYIMLLIMLGTGALGGLVNFLLPDNNPTKKEYLKPWYNCVILGLGATLVVPLFLEIAQSKLMDNIRFDFKMEASSKPKNDSLTVNVALITNAKAITDSVKIGQINTLLKNANNSTANDNQGKNYLLWTAYCLLAAAAGFKFINMLISGVFKANKIEELQTAKAKVEQENEKRKMQGLKSQEEEIKNLMSFSTENNTHTKGIIEEDLVGDKKRQMFLNLPAVTKANDPQKGRFGGSAKSNGRQLLAEVHPTENENYFDIRLKVEPIENGESLTDEVLFFLHDSFSPSVIKVFPVDGKYAEIKSLIAYGAFTIGVVTDNGATMLELDLAKDEKFVNDKNLKKFIER
jgi:hypothetical protein